MRKALVVGLNHYNKISRLFGCVNDAHAVKSVLERHADGTVNFGVKLLTSSSAHDNLTRTTLKEHVRELFSGDGEISLFYFAGHGHIESTGGYLCASDCSTGDDGLPLAEVLTLANGSTARNRVVILDSCHSGIAGNLPSVKNVAEISEGLTILTASTADQYANEANGAGIFTGLFVDALMGAAANLVGDITPGSIYAHIDQSLGPWDQRPVFKTNVKSFVSLRKVQPPIGLGELQRLIELFPVGGFEFPLDPTFEPERPSAMETDAALPPPDPEHVEKFSLLQKYNRVNLVVPLGASHMWHAAMQSKSCKLTVLGEHYRRLLELKRI